MKCNAWLLDESAKIPYLVSSLWVGADRVDGRVKDRILGSPDTGDMQV